MRVTVVAATPMTCDAHLGSTGRGQGHVRPSALDFNHNRQPAALGGLHVLRVVDRSHQVPVRAGRPVAVPVPEPLAMGRPCTVPPFGTLLPTWLPSALHHLVLS